MTPAIVDPKIVSAYFGEEGNLFHCTLSKGENHEKGWKKGSIMYFRAIFDLHRPIARLSCIPGNFAEEWHKISWKRAS